MVTLTIAEKAEACREWVETGLGKALTEDPSGFLAGIESVPVVLALEEIIEHLRDLDGSREPTDEEATRRGPYIMDTRDEHDRSL